MTITVGGTNITMNDSTVQATAFLGERGQVFTGNGTFTIPAGITAIKVTVIGGGGGSGATTGNPCAGIYVAGSGAGGGAAVKYLTGLTPGNTLTVTVGAGGTAGANTNGNGGTGGTSSVASGTQTITTISATGGSGGLGGNSVHTRRTGGVGSNGDLNLTGSQGLSVGATQFNMIGGAAPLFSATTMSSAQNVESVSIAGAAYGGGASGGTSATNAKAGSAGGAGVVFIEW